eukprot:72889_1
MSPPRSRCFASFVMLCILCSHFSDADEIDPGLYPACSLQLNDATTMEPKTAWVQYSRCRPQMDCTAKREDGTTVAWMKQRCEKWHRKLDNTHTSNAKCKVKATGLMSAVKKDSDGHHIICAPLIKFSGASTFMRADTGAYGGVSPEHCRHRTAEKYAIETCTVWLTIQKLVDMFPVYKDAHDELVTVFKKFQVDECAKFHRTADRDKIYVTAHDTEAIATNPTGVQFDGVCQAKEESTSSGASEVEVKEADAHLELMDQYYYDVEVEAAREELAWKRLKRERAHASLPRRQRLHQ